jgi:short-subunit dehydrogenase
MATTLEGSTALVTGATAGIGRAIAQQLATLGAEVVVHGRSPERGAKTVQAIENRGGKARFVAVDLSTADEVRRLADEAGPVDILINNAGVYRFGATADTDDAFFDEHVNLNLRAPYILVQKLVPGMVERGHGAVVNISTVAASTPLARRASWRHRRSPVCVTSSPLGRAVNTVSPATETPGTASRPLTGRARHHHGAGSRPPPQIAEAR